MKLNKFDSLSSEDKQFIITLCENHSYTEAVKILAQPNPTDSSSKPHPPRSAGSTPLIAN